MCLAKAIIESPATAASDAEQASAEETIFCENVARVEVKGDHITVYDLIGRPYETTGAIRQITFVGESRIVISPAS